MGWSEANRAQEVQSYRGPWLAVEGVVVSAAKVSSSAYEDWFLMEARRPGGELVERYISVMVWRDLYGVPGDGSSSVGCVGMTKLMDEATGPCYYNCPAEWLDEVPEPESPYSAAWRSKVRALAADRKAA